jgi:hypothetical protein
MEPFLTFSDRRDLRERGWRMWVGRGDMDDENDTAADHRGDPGAAGRARAACSATRRTRTGASRTPWPARPRRTLELMEAVWTPAVARVREEVADMQAIARADQARHHHRAVGLPVLRREGAQGPLRPGPERGEAVPAARQAARRHVLGCGRTVRLRVPGRGRRAGLPRRCRCMGGHEPRRRLARRPVLLRPVRTAGQALRCVDERVPQAGAVSSNIEGTPLYVHDTYTYIKKCEHKVIGYAGGAVQLLKGPCFYGGIRDILSFVRPLTRGDQSFMANINGRWGETLPKRILMSSIDTHSPSDILLSIGGHSPVDIMSILKGVVVGAESNVPISIGGHLHVDITASIYTYFLSDLSSSIGMHIPKDISGFISGHHWINLYSILSGHLPVDLSTSVFPIEPVDLSGVLRGVVIDNIQAFIKGHTPKDISEYIWVKQTGARDLQVFDHGWAKSDISFGIGWHFYGFLLSKIRGWAISGITQSVYGWQESFIANTIDIHSPMNINAYVRVWQTSADVLSKYIRGWQESDLSSYFKGTHDPSDFEMVVFVKQRSLIGISGFIHAWHEGIFNSYINAVTFNDLLCDISLIEPSNLSSYIKVRCISGISSSLHVLNVRDLVAAVNIMQTDLIYSDIVAYPINCLDLRFYLKSITAGVSGLPCFCHSFIMTYITASIKALYFDFLSAYLFPVVPVDIKSNIQGLDERFISAYLNVYEYPWNLTASIVGSGGFSSIRSSLSPVAAMNVYKILSCTIHSFDHRDVMSDIFCVMPAVLSAYINPKGYSSNLYCSIYPKVIRLTTNVMVHTMSHRNLSGIINAHCFYSDHRNLFSSIMSVFKSDLLASIFPVFWVYKPSSIGGVIGYADTISSINRLTMRVTVFTDFAFCENEYKLKIKVFSAASYLRSFVYGELTSRQITSSINSVRLKGELLSGNIKNREKVIRKNYAGVLQDYKVVEMSFKSVVSEYYYSVEGNYTWSKDVMDKWMLVLKSYIPKNTLLNTKRKLYKMTNLYDLKDFSSIDDAVKFAIDYVTEQPVADLGATLFNNSAMRALSAFIIPRYTKSMENNISGNINSIPPTVFVSKIDGNLSKIN